MRLEVTGRHVDITPALRRLLDTKLSKLERLLNDSAVSAQAVLTREKHRHRADITLHARGEKFFHGVGNSASWAGSLTEAIGKIAQQAQKVKGKWQERKRRGSRRGGAPVEQPEPLAETTASAARRPSAGSGRGERGEPRGGRLGPRMPRILRASRQTVKAMSVADAAREIDAIGDGVLVFRDAETAALSVLYRRHNGELTLVETEK
jgi:putative sigma-54 modulation protein